MNNPNTLEKRLQLLEEKFEYQDLMLDQLNDVIISQQTELESLRHELKLFQQRIQAMQENEIDNPPPPHY